MRIGSLFAGIGGLELGLERAGIGETVWQVEINEYCRAVLAKHWPHAERYEDVRTVGKSTLAPVDLICGGFPCTDVSSAGKRVGLAGAQSGLWFEYKRIVSELRPTWVVVENVTSGAAKWVDAVQEDLGELGCASVPFPLTASALGFDHKRARIFVVAISNADQVGIRVEQRRLEGPSRKGEVQSSVACEARQAQTAERSVAYCERLPLKRVVRGVHGLPKKLDTTRRRQSALGNSVIPACAEVIGHIIAELMR